MNEQPKIQVTNKWIGDLAVIYSIKNLEDALLPEVLLFYSKDDEPNFTYHEEKTFNQIEPKHPNVLRGFFQNNNVINITSETDEAYSFIDHGHVYQVPKTIVEQK